MAQLSFSDLMSSGNKSSDKNRVGFFSLKNDGDEALVRIMHDDRSSLENVALSIHSIDVNGKNRKINCIKEAYEPTDACPLCAAGLPIQNRVFIKLVEYTRDEKGNIIATPKIWERPAKKEVPRLSGYMDEYGPLSDCIFKIKRRGAPKDTATDYDFLPLPAHNYPLDKFPKTDAFDDYKLLGGFVLNKNAEDINYFLNNGNFPMDDTNASVPQGKPYSASASAGFNAPEDSVDDFIPFEQASNTPDVPWGNDASTINKPTRFY